MGSDQPAGGYAISRRRALGTTALGVLALGQGS